jgi:hypothetical protein
VVATHVDVDADPLSVATAAMFNKPRYQNIEGLRDLCAETVSGIMKVDNPKEAEP